MAQAIPEVLKDVLGFLCSKSELEVAKRRLGFLVKWNKRASQLAPCEAQLKSKRLQVQSKTKRSWFSKSC